MSAFKTDFCYMYVVQYVVFIVFEQNRKKRKNDKKRKKDYMTKHLIQAINMQCLFK